MLNHFSIPPRSLKNYSKLCLCMWECRDQSCWVWTWNYRWLRDAPVKSPHGHWVLFRNEPSLQSLPSTFSIQYNPIKPLCFKAFSILLKTLPVPLGTKPKFFEARSHCIVLTGLGLALCIKLTPFCLYPSVLGPQGMIPVYAPPIRMLFYTSKTNHLIWFNSSLYTQLTKCQTEVTSLPLKCHSLRQMTHIPGTCIIFCSRGQFTLRPPCLWLYNISTRVSSKCFTLFWYWVSISCHPCLEVTALLCLFSFFCWDCRNEATTLNIK